MSINNINQAYVALVGCFPRFGDKSFSPFSVCVRVPRACVRACVREKRKIEGEGGTGGAGVDRDGGKKPKEREEERKEKSARKTAEEKKTGVQAEADTGEDSCSLLSGS